MNNTNNTNNNNINTKKMNNTNKINNNINKKIITINDKYKNLLIGGISGAVSRTLTAPLELIKIQQQNYYLKHSQWNNVLKNEGILGFWKGNFTNCIRIFPQSAINFYCFNVFKKILEENSSTLQTQSSFNAGLISGILSITAIYPLENARTRLSLQINKKYYYSLFDVFKKTKIINLYKGLGTSLIGFPPYNAISFSINEIFKKEEKYITNKYYININIYKLISGGLSGIIAVSITYPTDVIRRRLQIQKMNNNIPNYNGLIDCIIKMKKNEGIYSFYRGLNITYIKIFPMMSIQFYMFDILQNIL